MTTRTYDDIAEWYDEWVGSHPMTEDPYFPSVQALMGEIAGQVVCDLACGQGRVSRHLADLGAKVVGVDLSDKLLAIARDRERREPRGIDYLQGDVRRLKVVPDGSFDGVVCHMALMDIADLPPTAATVARILRPRGWFVFSLLHPCYHTVKSGELSTPQGPAWSIAGYFAEGYWRSDTRPGPPGKIGAYHRTLSTYINTFIEHDLTLECLSEPCADLAAPELASPSVMRRSVWAEVPAVLVGRCRKQGKL
jgi:SAM-dependent methyltransferase